MTRPNTPISPLRARMLEDLALRKLEPKTQATYIRAVEKLSAFLKRSPATASAEELASSPNSQPPCLGTSKHFD